jgi:flavin reductase (DIM6/NTAB) family NADH-FMN oxidoreductase RutF
MQPLFYRPGEPHGLKRNPFNALVMPRPIGWISSLDKSGGVNLAPYSFFNAIAYTPPQVMFSATAAHEQGGLKDSLANIKETSEFVCNLVPHDLREKMNMTSVPAPHGIDEFEIAGLEPLPSRVVRPPRVAGCPGHLECVMTQVVPLESDDPSSPANMVIGRVVGIHIDDRFIVNGMVDMAAMDLIARLGYMAYSRVTEIFDMKRPQWPAEDNK